VEPITQWLLARGKGLLVRKRERVRLTGDPGVDDFLNDIDGHPYAFVLGCIMDRRVKFERAWLIPYEIRERTGARTFRDLAGLQFAAIKKAMSRPTVLHPYANVMAENFFAAVRRIDEEYGGDASRIWSGRPPSAAIVRRFLEFKGAGPKIATMAANILVRDFKIPVQDKFSIDISVDTHVRRVFKRLALVPEDATDEQINYRARELNPRYPGVFDLSVFEIGRQWCHKRKPDCSPCPLRDCCPTAPASVAHGR